MTDGETAQMRRRIVFARFIVAISRWVPWCDRAFEPLQNVLPQSRLVVVDEHRCRDMHCAHQDKAFTHLTRLDLLRHLVGDIDDLRSEEHTSELQSRV